MDQEIDQAPDVDLKVDGDGVLDTDGHVALAGK